MRGESPGPLRRLDELRRRAPRLVRALLVRTVFRQSSDRGPDARRLQRRRPRIDLYSGTLTRWAIHRRQVIAADNSGSLTLGGNLRDAIVEGCTLANPYSEIKVDEQAQGIVLRNNTFAGATSPRYTGGGIKNAVVVPAGGEVGSQQVRTVRTGASLRSSPGHPAIHFFFRCLSKKANVASRCA